jgi:hypothetical protein
MLRHHDFGQQNTEAEGHEQMDYALEQGVFLIQLRCILFLREETYGSTGKFLEPGLKKQEEEKRLFWLQNWRS